jgi:hypothetical protein
MANFLIRAAAQMHGLNLYWRTTKLLEESQAWDEQRHAEYQIAQLQRIILVTLFNNHCIAIYANPPRINHFCRPLSPIPSGV